MLPLAARFALDDGFEEHQGQHPSSWMAGALRLDPRVDEGAWPGATCEAVDLRVVSGNRSDPMAVGLCPERCNLLVASS
jgi:hypothetical protein